MTGDEDDGMFGAVLDDEQRLQLARIQAFMAAAEGYADHVMHGVGRTMLSTFGKIDEAMRRYREDGPADQVFEQLLGLQMTGAVPAGRAFCDTVVEQTDEATLSRMWGSADSLPSMPELEEPRLWLARTV